MFRKTYIFIAHGHVLSLYDILKGRYTKHIDCEGKIYQVFRSLSKNHNDKDKLEKQDFLICVLLENGRLLFITRRSGMDGEDVYDIDPKMEQNVHGRII